MNVYQYLADSKLFNANLDLAVQVLAQEELVKLLVLLYCSNIKQKWSKVFKWVLTQISTDLEVH